MADKMTYFNELRTAITNFIDAYEELKRCRDLPGIIGWVQADFTGLLASDPDGLTDIVLFDAIDTRIPIIITAFESVDDYLLKFRP
jgi:hypothetical protein